MTDLCLPRLRVRTAIVATARLCAALAVLILASAPLHAQPPQNRAPASKAPAGPTMESYYADRARFEREDIFEGYRRFGKRDAAWDVDAVKFLGEACEWLGRQDEGDAPAETVALGTRLVSAGCTDPMVQAIYTSVANPAAGDAEKMLAVARRGAQGLDLTPCEPLRRSVAWMQVARLEQRLKHPAEADAAFRKAADLCFQAVTDPKLPAERMRFVWSKLETRVRADLPAEIAEELVGKVDGSASVDPWLRDMTIAIWHYRKAWAARGSGRADTVTPEGWKGFKENFLKAREHFEAAAKRSPDRPEPATYMIEVAYAGHAAPNQGARYWFDRATDAQFDWRWAYEKMLFSLDPRWGGSHARMASFGLECAKTKRYDTRVPYVLVQALLDACEQTKDYDAIWRRPNIYPAVKEALAGMAAQQPSRAAHDKSLLAAIAWRADAFDDLKTLLDELGPRFDHDVIWKVRAFYQPMQEDAAIFNSPAAPTFREGLAAWRKGQWAAASRAYALALDACKDAPQVTRFAAQARATAAAWMAELAAGEWLKIAFDQRQSGWMVVSGAWTSPDQARAIATPVKASNYVNLLRLPVGQNFAIRGEIDLGPKPPPKLAAGVIFGYEINTEANARWMSWLISAGDGTASNSIRMGFTRGQDVPVTLVPGPNRFLLEVRDGEAKVELNGAVVMHAKLPADNSGWRPGEIIGLGAWQVDGAGPITYSNLEIRRLK